MTTPARAAAGWLRLREPADAAARSEDLVAELRRVLNPRRALLVHDLGSGTGSMARWLAPRLGTGEPADAPLDQHPGPALDQRWVLHDRDHDLLTVASTDPPRTRDGAEVTVETRLGDITRMPVAELDGADVIVASALLDMMTNDELDRFVVTCDAVGCAVLVALSVTGEVRLAPPEPLDDRVRDAFNAHQRRHTSGGTLLGPDAGPAAVAAFRGRGREVLVRDTDWRLGPPDAELAAEWFRGWWRAACEQSPVLASHAGYAERRLRQTAAGRLAVTVGHLDLLVRPS